jgi:hypothetical protein
MHLLILSVVGFYFYSGAGMQEFQHGGEAPLTAVLL